MKKLLVMLMALAMMVTMLASCDSEPAGNAETTVAATEAPTEAPTEPSPEAVMEQANAATMATPYILKTSMKFSSDNAEMNQIFSAMTMEYPIVMDGDNLSMDMSMDMGEGIKLNMVMTVVDQVLYYDMDVAGTSAKMKCTLTDEQMKEFVADSGVEMPVSPEEFANMTMEKKDNTYTIVFEELSDAGKEILDDMIGESLGVDAGATANMKSLSYITTITDGKYDELTLTCEYTMNVEGMSFNVKMDMGFEYEYENVPEIKVPADAADYQEVPYDEIMG